MPFSAVECSYVCKGEGSKERVRLQYNKHTCNHTHTYKHILATTQIHTHSCNHTNTHTSHIEHLLYAHTPHTHAHKHTHACARTHTHTYICAHTHTYTHKHTHAKQAFLQLQTWITWGWQPQWYRCVDAQSPNTHIGDPSNTWKSMEHLAFPAYPQRKEARNPV